jgi:hypothetical protein
MMARKTEPGVDAQVVDLVAAYKRRVAGAYRPLPLDALSNLPKGPLLVSRKLDGEFWCLLMGPAGPQLVNPGGRMLAGNHPVLVAAASLLPAGVMLAGELHSAPIDRRERVGDVAGGLAAGGEGLHFTVFDIVREADGAEPARRYDERLTRLETWLAEATGPLQVVVTERLPDVTALQQHYEAVVGEGGAEGLVVRVVDGIIYKVKPVIDIDAVVIGFTEKTAEPGQVRSLLLGLRHPDGSIQVLGGCGTVGTSEVRRELLSRLAPLQRPSTVRQASDGGGLYAFVRPELVVTIHVTDLQAERSDGSLTQSPRLVYTDGGWQGAGIAPCPRPIHPSFDRVREDKDASGPDVRFAQVEPWMATVEDAAGASVVLPGSTMIRRAVWTKVTKGQTAVRKLLVWKTNKDMHDRTYPAFVVHWTDYSAGRAAPLEREVRLAPNEDEALRLADAFVAEHIKKGWELVGGSAHP